MSLPRCTIPLLAFLAFALAQPISAQPATASPTDEQTLKNVGLKTDGAALLDFFQKRTPGTLTQEQVRSLVKQLADKDATVRDKAAADLIGLGAIAVPALRQAANDFDNADAAAKAHSSLQAIDGGGGASLAASAARLLAQTHPAGSAEVLLGYAPFAEDDMVLEEMGKALNSVALRDGKLDPALSKALKDEVPIRRALAGEVLSKSGLPEGRAAVRYLLQDVKPSVRLRAALALAEARDAEAITVLIGLLGDLPPGQSRQVEDFLVQFAGEWSTTTPQGNDEISRRMRREIWNTWWQATEGSALLDEVRKRSLDDTTREKAEGLIKQLADDNQPVRDKAMTDLLGMGSVVAPLVRQAAQGAPPAGTTPPGQDKIAPQAQKCLQLLMDKGAVNPLPAAAPRLLAVRKPEGAVAALLAYLPFVEDESVMSEVQTALVAMAVHDGKTDPALAKALDDKLPLRRAVAAEVLAQTALNENVASLHKLLDDADLITVRLRAALALAEVGDKKAVPVLVALLSEVPINQALQIEEYLRFVAREQAPELSLGGEDTKPQKVREAWAAWWQGRPGDFVLPRVDHANHLLGYTMLVEQFSPIKGTGRVIELDGTGRTRWSIEGLQGPCDAQVLPGDKVLIVEMNINRVSEREVKGKMIWERNYPAQPICAKRLPNGNTFIAVRNQILELDRAGKEVVTYNRPNHDIMAAAKMRDGTTAFVTYGWQYIRLDAQGKEIKNTRIAGFPVNVQPMAVEFLANDRVLAAHFQQGKVVEMDLNGKVLWEASIASPNGVSRLPNGNTLVSCVNAGRAVELDRTGKVVWEYKDNIRPALTRRR